MKTILLLLLIVFSVSQDQLVGGWQKRSIQENSFEIDQSFKKAGLQYIKEHPETNLDDLLRLTVYSQIVSGTNYKVTFFDTNDKLQTIHEYIVYKPLGNKRKRFLFKVTEHNEYNPTNGLLSEDDASMQMLEDKLSNHLKDTKEKLYNIRYAYPVETAETLYYIITASTAEGNHRYIIYQDKQSKEFYDFQKIN